MSEQRMLAAIGRIYEAAVQPQRLGELNVAIQQALGVQSAILFLTDHGTGELVELLGASANFDAAARADYRAHYHARNPWYQTATGLKGRFVKRGDEYIAYRDFEKTEFRADWCPRVDIYHMMGGVAPVRGELSVACGVHRPHGAVAFAEDDKQRMSLVLEHVARAVQIADSLGLANKVAALTLDVVAGLGTGLVVLDEQSRPLLVNGVAERLLRHSRWLCQVREQIRPVHPACRADFERRVHAAARTSAGSGMAAGGPMRLPDPLDRHLPIMIVPFRSESLELGPGQPAAAVLFSDPDETSAPDGARIAELFGLTSAEGRLVSVLLGGQTLVDAAARIGVSINTARTQLQSVFSKLGVCRQSDLAALVLGHPLVRLRELAQRGAAAFDKA